MKDFSKTHITFLVLFLITGLAGGYFWYWSVGDLESAQKAKVTLEKKRSDVSNKALAPTEAVRKALEASKKEFDDLSLKSLEEVRAGAGLFDSVVTKQEEGKAPVGLPSDSWKKLMNEKRLQLDSIKAKNKVTTPENPYYGFQRYRVSNPSDQVTGQLGIQLLGLEELSTILLESKVKEYRSAKRIFVEDARGSSSQAAGDESISGAVLNGPEGLYQVYPFELQFKCSTPVLRLVVNRINQSKYFFVIRFMIVENEKANVKSRSTITQEMAADAARTGRLLVPVAGDEFLQVRMRVDMLVWSKPKLEVAK